MPTSILLIDAQLSHRRAMGHLLQRRSCYRLVGEAGSREEVMDYLKRPTLPPEDAFPDFVILELNLGKDDGLQLLRDFKTLRPDSRILVVTNHNQNLYSPRVFKAGGAAPSIGELFMLVRPGVVLI